MVIDKIKGKLIDSLQAPPDPEARDIPPELCIIPLKDSVVYPLTISPIKIEKPESLQAIDEAMARDKIIGVVAFKENTKQYKPENLYKFGSAVLIHKLLKIPGQGTILIVQGIQKIYIESITQTNPYWRASVKTIHEDESGNREIEALMKNALSRIQKLIALVPYLPEELQMAASQVEEPLRLAYLIASLIRMKLGEKQKILEIQGVANKLKEAVSIMNREIELLELGNKIQSDVHDELDKAKKEYFLKQQLKAIQKELGEDLDDQLEIEELSHKIEEANLPEEVYEEAKKELKRIKNMPPAASEYHVIRTYLDWLIEIPWINQTEDNLDLDRAQEILDEDHYDLKKIKERIIEYLAVRKLKNDMKGPILCLIGPPGVGKTSLGKSIARALNREFIRQSLGGMHDEAEIRGHRRTYIGSMPGKIIQSIKRAGTCNPVFMLDEIDKIGQDFRGDPSSALLEVLDPEQNNSFMDHYLGLNFDLSKVLFIATGNTTSTIQRPLLDRMEILHLSGYALEEKVHIAKKYLIPKQIEEHGLKPEKIAFQIPAIKLIISNYTRESGVRSLERQIANVCRKVAAKVATGYNRKITVTTAKIKEYLGPQKVFNEVAMRTSRSGVATGLAWTESGGETLGIEVVLVKGTGKFILTGKLGTVMQESAQAALTFIKAHGMMLGVKENIFKTNDFHIHVPEGAVPKDGPSAGTAMVSALASAVSSRPLKKDIAMTGEITLSGKVLAIGGFKEKALAAYREGIKTVFFPKGNVKDLEEIPVYVQKKINFVPVGSIDDYLSGILEKKKARPNKKS